MQSVVSEHARNMKASISLNRVLNLSNERCLGSIPDAIPPIQVTLHASAVLDITDQLIHVSFDGGSIYGLFLSFWQAWEIFVISDYLLSGLIELRLFPLV